MNQQTVLTAKDLWSQVDFQPNSLIWKFSDIRSAKAHLRAYEPYLANWGWQFQRQVSIRVEGGLNEWQITPRREDIPMDFLPLPPHTSSEAEEGGATPNDAERFLVFAQSVLDARIIELLSDMQSSDSVLAIVDWRSQKQIVMNSACSQIPIGDSLEECLNWSRYDYWKQDDLEAFERECRQDLRADGSNSIEFEYLTFDPVDLRSGGDGDWIKIRGEYRFLDCGRFGLFQHGRNLEFQSVPAPN